MGHEAPTKEKDIDPVLRRRWARPGLEDTYIGSNELYGREIVLLRTGDVTEC